MRDRGFALACGARLTSPSPSPDAGLWARRGGRRNPDGGRPSVRADLLSGLGGKHRAGPGQRPPHRLRVSPAGTGVREPQVFLTVTLKTGSKVASHLALPVPCLGDQPRAHQAPAQVTEGTSRVFTENAVPVHGTHPGQTRPRWLLSARCNAESQDGPDRGRVPPAPTRILTTQIRVEWLQGPDMVTSWDFHWDHSSRDRTSEGSRSAPLSNLVLPETPRLA